MDRDEAIKLLNVGRIGVAVMPSWTDPYHPASSLGFGTSLLVYSGLTLRRPGGAALPRGS